MRSVPKDKLCRNLQVHFQHKRVKNFVEEYGLNSRRFIQDAEFKLHYFHVKSNRRNASEANSH